MILKERERDKEFRQTIFDSVRKYDKSECDSISLQWFGTFEVLVKYNFFNL